MEWNPVEIVAVLFGIASVVLMVRQNIWCWPTTLVNVSLYAVIFSQARLYALMGLQGFYAAIAVYGWYHWLFGGEGRTELGISKTPTGLRLVLPLLGLAGTAGLGTVLARTTDDALPYLGAALAVASLIAQWMLSRKYLENWLVWIGVNVVTVLVLPFQGLGVTSIQYAVFLVLVIRGYIEWKRSWERDRPAAGQPAPPPVLGAEV